MAAQTKISHIASIWAEGAQIGMVCFRKENKTYTPLDSWRSNLAGFSFNFVEILEQWKQKYSLTRAILNKPPSSQSNSKRHPILTIIPVSCKTQPAIEIFEGLAYLHHHLQQDTLDFSHYPKNRLMEQVSRVDTDRNPIVLAFLQGIAVQSSGAVVPSVGRRQSPKMD